MDEKIDCRTIGIMTTIWLLLLGYLVWFPLQNERHGYVGAFITGETSVQQIVRILIKKPDGESFEYVKMSDHWQIQEPYQAAASEPMIQELLGAVGKTRIMDIVVKQPETLSPYGLEEGKRIEATFEFENGRESTFRIGARLPLNQIYVYFQKEGDSSVFRVWEGIRSTLERHASVLDQGQPVRFNPSTIVSLELEREGRFVRLEKRNVNWFVTSPMQRAATTETVQLYLESILALTSSEAYPDGAMFQKKVDNSNHFKLTLNQDNGGEPITIHLTPKDSLAPALLAIEQGGQSVIYSTDPRAMDKLSFDPDDFYLSNALVFDIDTITNIEVLKPQYSLKLKRNPDGSWQFYHPYDRQRADSDTVNQLLHLLRNLPVEQYLEEEKENIDSAESGILVKLFGNTDSTTLKIIKNPSGHYRGTSVHHPHWYRLNSDTIKRLGEFSPDALVDRHLLAFDPLSVERITVQRGENYYVLTKKGNAWTWEKPQKKKARTAMAWRFVFGIRNLQYQRLVRENTGRGSREDHCGFLDPDITIYIQLAGAEVDNEMRLKAAKTREGMIVSTSLFPGCYLVETAFADHILPDFAVLED